MESRFDRASSGREFTRAAWRWVGTTAACVGVLGAAASVAPDVQVGPITAFLFGFGAVGVASVAVGATCPPLGRRALWLALVPIAILTALTETEDADFPTAALVAASLLFGGSLLGAVVGREVEHAGYLIYVAIVSAAVDVASVLHPSGPSAVIAASPKALSLIAVPFPILGTDRIGPLLGVGDVVFTSLYLAACRRHGLSTSRTVFALLLGFAATALTVVFFARPIPALPLLGAAVVVVHPAAARPPKAERRRGFVTVGVIVTICALVLVHRYR